MKVGHKFNAEENQVFIGDTVFNIIIRKENTPQASHKHCPKESLQ